MLPFRRWRFVHDCEPFRRSSGHVPFGSGVSASSAGFLFTTSQQQFSWFSSFAPFLAPDRVEARSRSQNLTA